MSKTRFSKKLLLEKQEAQDEAFERGFDAGRAYEKPAVDVLIKELGEIKAAWSKAVEKLDMLEYRRQATSSVLDLLSGMSRVVHEVLNTPLKRT